MNKLFRKYAELFLAVVVLLVHADRLGDLAGVRNAADAFGAVMTSRIL